MDDIVYGEPIPLDKWGRTYQVASRETFCNLVISKNSKKFEGRLVKVKVFGTELAFEARVMRVRRTKDDIVFEMRADNLRKVWLFGTSVDWIEFVEREHPRQ